MHKNPIITEQPKVKIKGFQESQLKIVAATPQDLDVQKKILALKSGPGYAALPLKDRRLIDIFASSYAKKSSGTSLAPEDYTLSGHEILEWDKLEEDQHLRYLVYRYRYSKNPELKIVDDYPPCVQIEPSSICNFRCVMCYQSDASFSARNTGFMGYMQLDLFKKVIDELTGKVEAITLASRGEPTLNKSFIQMLEYLRGKFLGVKVNTNASVLTEEMIHALFAADIATIAFSIDSADKEMYEKIRVGGKFETLIKNLGRFVEIKNKHYPKTKSVIRISGVKINDQQNISKMNDVWKRYADLIAFTNYIPWQSTYENTVNDIEQPCSDLWRRTFVWQDGKVNPCDYDYKSTLSRWNVRDKSISDIWNSPEYNALRRAHLEKKRGSLEPCRRCIFV